MLNTNLTSDISFSFDILMFILFFRDNPPLGLAIAAVIIASVLPYFMTFINSFQHFYANIGDLETLNLVDGELCAHESSQTRESNVGQEYECHFNSEHREEKIILHGIV